MNQLKKILLALCVIMISGIVVLLITEYFFFKEQAQKMMELQTQYRSYMQTMQGVMDDYAKTKERLMLLEELNSGEKKNAENQVTFPEGSRVFSSDDKESESTDSFLVVNRDLEYLKESTISHIKEQDAASLLSRIDLDQWRDYTEQLLERKKAASQKQKRKRVASRTKKSQHVPALETSVPPDIQEELQTIVSPGKRDIALSWPIDRSRFWLSSFFGPRRKRNGSRGFHYGIDMAAIKGTSVMAAASGIVIEAWHAPGYGNTVVIAHNGKYKTRYAHLKSIFVSPGHKVRRGAIIGTVGDTGFVRSAFGRDPSHLHFELYMFGRQVNPMHFLA